MSIRSRDVMAFGKVKFLYEKMEYSEEYDVLYHYMNSFIKEEPDIIFFRDEIENLLGIKSHTDIIKYIINDLC